MKILWPNELGASPGDRTSVDGDAFQLGLVCETWACTACAGPRVTALERYAAQVSAARTAYRDWQDALRVSHLNDKYLDLVARTAADEQAIVEISGLAEQAAAAAQAFRDSVQHVSLAAAALVLPDSEAR